MFKYSWNILNYRMRYVMQILIIGDPWRMPVEHVPPFLTLYLKGHAPPPKKKLLPDTYMFGLEMVKWLYFSARPVIQFLILGPFKPVWARLGPCQNLLSLMF